MAIYYNRFLCCLIELILAQDSTSRPSNDMKHLFLCSI